MIDSDGTSPGGRRRKVYRDRKRSSERQGNGTGYIYMQDEARKELWCRKHVDGKKTRRNREG